MEVSRTSARHIEIWLTCGWRLIVKSTSCRHLGWRLVVVKWLCVSCRWLVKIVSIHWGQHIFDSFCCCILSVLIWCLYNAHQRVWPNSMNCFYYYVCFDIGAERIIQVTSIKVPANTCFICPDCFEHYMFAVDLHMFWWSACHHCRSCVVVVVVVVSLSWWSWLLWSSWLSLLRLQSTETAGW